MRHSDLFYNIKCFFAPKQRWLTKLIPNRWRDKDTILEITVFACLRHYVEEELGLEWVSNPNRWKKEDTCPQEQIDFENECYVQYLLLVDSLPALETALEKKWEEAPKRKPGEILPGFGQDFIEAVNAQEKAIYAMKSGIMTWVIEHRDRMWT